MIVLRPVPPSATLIAELTLVMVTLDMVMLFNVVTVLLVKAGMFMYGQVIVIITAVTLRFMQVMLIMCQQVTGAMSTSKVVLVSMVAVM